MLARLIACAFLALAAAPAAALADGEPPPVPVPAADALMATAHSFAVARWGMDPCGGQVTTTWNHMGEGINARSQWMSVDSHDPSTYSDCSITYNLDVDWDWPKLCTVVEHELGHLSGHDHVDDPHDVMSPYYVYPSAECAAATAQVTPPAPEVAPQSGTSSRRASSTKRKAKKRRATAAAKGKSTKRTKKSSRRSRKKARRASLSVLAAASGIAGAASLGSRSGHSAASLGTPGFFGCVLVDGR